uniref:CCHC-type domain-containing protein n=1 Tax=Haemonchus contortus TaxID=6289 RepID=A0A7I4YY91_HAECO
MPIERVNEVENLKEQLRQAQRSLHQLKCAIPILPDADVLYEKIVRTCTDHYTHTQAVTSLEEKLRRLRLSDKPSEQRLSEIGSLNLEIDYLTLQFRFCRSQLFTLFSVPPLLIALDKMTPQEWETLMRRPQETSPNKPLVMDLNTLENITFDQLQALNSLRFSLNDFRAEAQNDADKEQLPFEGEPRNRLDSMQKFNLDIQDAVKNALHGKAPAPVQDAGEGTPKVRGEDEIIRENEEFIEGLIESGSEHDDHDDQVSVDEDMGSDSAHDDLSEAEGSEEEPEEVWQEEPDEPEQEEPEDEDQRELEDEDDIPEEFPRRENLRRRAIQIENEIRSTEQAIHNFEEILRQYEQEPLCPPRRFDLGRIVRGNERYMKCAFCEASGIHYSDSCTAFRDPLERRELIREAGRCWTCLERMCARGATCRKYLTPCFYCRDRGHHSALCDFPDHSDYIRTRMEDAKEGRRRSLNRLRDLQRERAYLGVDL